MATIIRAADRARGAQGVAFHLDDLAARAEAHREDARTEAERIVEGARQDAENLREQAQQEGFARGMEQVEQIVARQLAGVLPALSSAVEDIQHAKHTWLRHWEACGVRVATAIAERVIRRELARRPEITVALVREALELAAGSSHLRIHLNPADRDALGDQVDLLTKELSPLGTAELISDPTITPGGCRVETQFGSVDQQFETQLRRIEEELT